jgi:hypothetical protein
VRLRFGPELERLRAFLPPPPRAASARDGDRLIAFAGIESNQSGDRKSHTARGIQVEDAPGSTGW